MKTVQAIIKVMRGDLLGLAQQSITVEVPGYHKLVIEAIGAGPRGLPAVSVAHYYKQNGDMMRDPEICFEVIQIEEGKVEWQPYQFTQDSMGLYQEAIFVEEGKIKLRPKLVEDLTAFSKMWSRNLSEQGFLAEAKKIAAAAKN